MFWRGGSQQIGGCWLPHDEKKSVNTCRIGEKYEEMMKEIWKKCEKAKSLISRPNPLCQSLFSTSFRNVSLHICVTAYLFDCNN
jgi:hypothetical protein